MSFIARVGKTERDRNSGRFERNQANKQERAFWQQNKTRNSNPFPLHTCNGKKSRALKS